MEYSIEITNSNGDVYYNTIDAVRMDQHNGWQDIDPSLRRALARRGLESLDLETALAMLTDATAEGDLQESLRGINGDTYAQLVRRGLDRHIAELTATTDAIDFELLVGGLMIHITYDPDDIETLRDAIEWVRRNPDTPAMVRTALENEMVVDFLSDYYDYVAWNEHGNQPSYGEMAEGGSIADSVLDLIEEPRHNITEYLSDGLTGDAREDTVECTLLLHRAMLQHQYGIEPDWNLWE